ncbi:MAG: hypothetical protein ACP5OK_06060 [Thermoprotei archaeon]|jgi:hypothetical protein
MKEMRAQIKIKLSIAINNGLFNPGVGVGLQPPKDYKLVVK